MSKTKRLLSLVLALTMVFALFAMSGVANADETTPEVTSSTAAVAVTSGEFTDFAEITYKDAVSVLQYINVLKGYEDGTYKPAATLTRAEGAAIINRLITASDAGSLVATDFTDVSRTHWASGYVAWGAKNNILNGYGDGTFGPSDTLTVLQYLKMILTGLGWGAAGEYVGSGWDTNVVVDATRLGLWGAVEPVAQDRSVSREEAAEFSLQALKQIPVYYGNAAYHYTNNATGVNVSGTDYEKALYNVHGLYYEYEPDKLGYLQYSWTSKKGGNVLAADKIAATRSGVVTPTSTRKDYTKGYDYADATIYVNGFDFSDYVAVTFTNKSGADVKHSYIITLLDRLDVDSPFITDKDTDGVDINLANGDSIVAVIPASDVDEIEDAIADTFDGVAKGLRPIKYSTTSFADYFMGLIDKDPASKTDGTYNSLSRGFKVSTYINVYADERNYQEPVKGTVADIDHIVAELEFYALVSDSKARKGTANVAIFNTVAGINKPVAVWAVDTADYAGTDLTKGKLYSIVPKFGPYGYVANATSGVNSASAYTWAFGIGLTGDTIDYSYVFFNAENNYEGDTAVAEGKEVLAFRPVVSETDTYYGYNKDTTLEFKNKTLFESVALLIGAPTAQGGEVMGAINGASTMHLSSIMDMANSGLTYNNWIIDETVAYNLDTNGNIIQYANTFTQMGTALQYAYVVNDADPIILKNGTVSKSKKTAFGVEGTLTYFDDEDVKIVTNGDIDWVDAVWTYGKNTTVELAAGDILAYIGTANDGFWALASGRDDGNDTGLPVYTGSIYQTVFKWDYATAFGYGYVGPEFQVANGVVEREEGRVLATATYVEGSKNGLKIDAYGTKGTFDFAANALIVDANTGKKIKPANLPDSAIIEVLVSTSASLFGTADDEVQVLVIR
jgi:hypothetical protein